MSSRTECPVRPNRKRERASGASHLAVDQRLRAARRAALSVRAFAAPTPASPVRAGNPRSAQSRVARAVRLHEELHVVAVARLRELPVRDERQRCPAVPLGGLRLALDDTRRAAHEHACAAHRLAATRRDTDTRGDRCRSAPSPGWVRTAPARRRGGRPRLAASPRRCRHRGSLHRRHLRRRSGWRSPTRATVVAGGDPNAERATACPRLERRSRYQWHPGSRCSFHRSRCSAARCTSR